VTGAGSGLGRAFCDVLAARGARIVVSDIDLASAEATAEGVRRAGGEAVVQVADVAKFDEVEALATLAERTFGGADLVINNAGVAVSGDLGDVPLEDWRWIVGINLMGVVHGCHAFVPRFKKQGSGAVINVASAAGLVHAPSMSAYNATKAAVVALSETLYAEVADLGIGVTVLCPTFFKTNIGRSSRGSDPRLQGFVEKLMEKSKLQAPEVAAFAIDSLENGRLMAVPMRDGRWFWRVKRYSPAPLYPKLMRQMSRVIRKQAEKGLEEQETGDRQPATGNGSWWYAPSLLLLWSLREPPAQGPSSRRLSCVKIIVGWRPTPTQRRGLMVVLIEFSRPQRAIEPQITSYSQIQERPRRYRRKPSNTPRTRTAGK
jgi:NAD(P)-dependent dehydrogenase (short-subunit alcohol dehydrogenase family)